MISSILILIGAILMLISAIGCLRYKNFFQQLHAAGVGDNGGLLLILLGIIIGDGFTIFSAKVSFLIIVILITSPTNTHLLSKLALLSGVAVLEKEEKEEKEEKNG